MSYIDFPENVITLDANGLVPEADRPAAGSVRWIAISNNIHIVNPDGTNEIIGAINATHTEDLRTAASTFPKEVGVGDLAIATVSGNNALYYNASNAAIQVTAPNTVTGLTVIGGSGSSTVTAFTDLTDTPAALGAIDQVVSVALPTFSVNRTRGSSANDGEFSVTTHNTDDFVLNLDSNSTDGTNQLTAIDTAAVAGAEVIVTAVGSTDILLRGTILGETDFGTIESIFLDGPLTTGAIADLAVGTEYTFHIGVPQLGFSDVSDTHNIPDYDPRVLEAGGYLPGMAVFTRNGDNGISPTDPDLERSAVYDGLIWAVPQVGPTMDSNGDPVTNVDLTMPRPASDPATKPPGINNDWLVRSPLTLGDTPGVVGTQTQPTLTSIIGVAGTNATDADVRVAGMVPDGQGGMTAVTPTTAYPSMVVNSQSEGISYIFRGATGIADTTAQGWYYYSGATVNEFDGLNRTADGELSIDQLEVQLAYNYQIAKPEGAIVNLTGANGQEYLFRTVNPDGVPAGTAPGEALATAVTWSATERFAPRELARVGDNLYAVNANHTIGPITTSPAVGDTEDNNDNWIQLTIGNASDFVPHFLAPDPTVGRYPAGLRNFDWEEAHEISFVNATDTDGDQIYAGDIRNNQSNLANLGAGAVSRFSVSLISVEAAIAPANRVPLADLDVATRFARGARLRLQVAGGTHVTTITGAAVGTNGTDAFIGIDTLPGLGFDGATQIEFVNEPERINPVNAPSAIPVVDYDRQDFQLNEMVRNGNEIYVVTNVTRANNTGDVENATSGFVRVGNFDNTHTIVFDGQTLRTGAFEFEQGDTVFLFDMANLTTHVELYRIHDVENGGFRITAGATAQDPETITSGTTSFLSNAADALDQLRAAFALRAVRGDRLGLALAGEAAPTEAPFFADRAGGVWELEAQQYQRQPDKTGQVLRITRDAAGNTTAVAPESTANTNLSDINTTGHSLAGDRNEVSVDVVASAITTVGGRPQGTLSVRFNRANSVGQAATVDDNDVLSMFAIRGAVLSLLDEGITDSNPQTFRVVDGDTTRYYACTGIIDRTDDNGATGGASADVYRGIELRVRNIFTPTGVSLTEAATFTNVDGLFLFNLAPTGGERIGAGLERDRDGTLHVDLDGSTLETSGGVLRVSNEGIGDAQLNTGAGVNRVIAEDAITTPKVRDRQITGIKLALDEIGPEHLNAQLRRDIQLDETAVTSRAITGEVLTTTPVISPSAFGDGRDWEMFIRPDGTRYIAFTEDDDVVTPFDITVGHHYTLRADDGAAGTAAVVGMDEQTNAIAQVEPHEVDSSYTISGAIRMVSASEIELRLINRNGISASTANPAVIPAGTVLRVNNFVAIINAPISIVTTGVVSVSGTGVTLNATTLTGEQTFRTVTVNHTQTRVELELVEDSTVGGTALFDYLDLLTPDSTSGGEGQLRIETTGEFYTRSSVYHTPSNQRWPVSADIVAHQEEFQVTAIRVGNANTASTNFFSEDLLPTTGVNAFEYNDVSVSWNTRPLSGEFNLVWRGNQEQIDTIITALGSTGERHGIYFNGTPTAGTAAVTTPHIRAISNGDAYLGGAGPNVLDLILTPGNDGFTTDVGVRSSVDELTTTDIVGLSANPLQVDRTTEVPARVRLSGLRQVGFISLPIPVVNQDVPATPFDVHTMYYTTANTDEGGSPFARPGNRIPLNTVPYRPGTNVQVTAGTVTDTMDLLFTGPDAQRAADDVVSTFYTLSTSNRGALFFANEGNGFSEVGYSVSIAFESYPANTHRMVGTAVTAHVPSTAIASRTGLQTRNLTNPYVNTTIAWHRQSNHSLLITVDGTDRFRLYRDLLRVFADGTSGDHFSLVVNPTGDGLPADVAAVPWLTIDVPDIPSYEDEEQQLISAGVTEPFLAPNSAFTQVGAPDGDTFLRLWELRPDTTETLYLTGDRTLTVDFASGDDNVVLNPGGGGSGGGGSVAFGTRNAFRDLTIGTSGSFHFPDTGVPSLIFDTYGAVSTTDAGRDALLTAVNSPAGIANAGALAPANIEATTEGNSCRILVQYRDATPPTIPNRALLALDLPAGTGNFNWIEMMTAARGTTGVTLTGTDGLSNISGFQTGDTIDISRGVLTPFFYSSAAAAGLTTPQRIAFPIKIEGPAAGGAVNFSSIYHWAFVPGVTGVTVDGPVYPATPTGGDANDFNLFAGPLVNGIASPAPNATLVPGFAPSAANVDIFTSDGLSQTVSIQADAFINHTQGQIFTGLTEITTTYDNAVGANAWYRGVVGGAAGDILTWAGTHWTVNAGANNAAFIVTT